MSADANARSADANARCTDANARSTDANARSTDASLLDFHRTAVFHLVRAHRTLDRYLWPARNRYGLHHGRDLVVIELARLGPGTPPKQLCHQLWLTPSSLSTVLRRSADAGYIRSEIDPDDGRGRRLTLTTTGRVTARLMAAGWRDAERIVGRRLGARRLAELLRLLKAATAALDAALREDRAFYLPGARPLGYGPRRPGPFPRPNRRADSARALAKDRVGGYGNSTGNEGQEPMKTEPSTAAPPNETRDAAPPSGALASEPEVRENAPPSGALASEPEVRENASARLRRIEGQVRGIQKMVEEGRYCPDILVQVASVRAALKGVSKVLMRQHLHHCVTDALRSGNPVAAEQTYDEVMELMYRHAGD